MQTALPTELWSEITSHLPPQPVKVRPGFMVKKANVQSDDFEVTFSKGIPLEELDALTDHFHPSKKALIKTLYESEKVCFTVYNIRNEAINQLVAKARFLHYEFPTQEDRNTAFCPMVLIRVNFEMFRI